MLQLLRRRRAGRPPASGSYRAATHVVAAVHGERTVLLDARRGEYFGIDEVGGEIWRALETGATLAEVVDRLEASYDAPRAVLERDAGEFLSLLQRKRLVSVA